MLRGMWPAWMICSRGWVNWIVYALYERSTKMACFLCCWFVFYTVVVFLLSRKTIHLLRLDSDCMSLEAPCEGAVISFWFAWSSFIDLRALISNHCQCPVYNRSMYPLGSDGLQIQIRYTSRLVYKSPCSLGHARYFMVLFCHRRWAAIALDPPPWILLNRLPFRYLYCYSALHVRGNANNILVGRCGT